MFSEPLSVVIVVGIVLAFGLFAVTLMWADHQTRNVKS